MPAPETPRPDAEFPPRDDRQIDAIVSAYAGLIARAVRRVAGARAADIADDVQQAVMVGVWRQLQRGQTIDHPASYIFRAAIRETVRLVKRAQQREPGPTIDPEDTPAEAHGQDPHRQLENKERQRALTESLESLAANRRQAVRAHLAGFDVRETMEMFGWSYETTRHAIARGMADLRRALRKRGMHE